MTDAKLIAGGMTLLPTLKQRLAAPSDLIDLAGVADLQRHFTRRRRDRHRRDDAPCRSAEARWCATHSGSCSLAGQSAIRRCAIAAPSAARSPTTIRRRIIRRLLALGATVRDQHREIAADDFFTGLFQTALEPGEIVTAVRFPRPVCAAIEKFRNPASRYATVGVFVAAPAACA